MKSGTYPSRCSAIYTKALLESQAPIYEKRDFSDENLWEKEETLGVKTSTIALCNWLHIATGGVFFLYHNHFLPGTSCTMFSGEEMPSRSGGRVRKDHRSACVMNMMVEMFGDPWSLLVIRDILFMNRRHFRELLTKSLEGIASNILADRLRRLVQQGIIVKSRDPSHKQKAIYSLTERGIELLPLLMEMNAWGHRYLPVSRLRFIARVLEEGGPKLRADFMAELRETHLPKSGAKKGARASTRSMRIFAMQKKLQAAYEAELAKRKQ